MSDITFVAFIRFGSEAAARRLANTLTYYVDETKPAFFEELSEFDQLPKSNSTVFESGTELVMQFNDDGFLASEYIGDISYEVGCELCLGLEYSDTKLFTEYKPDGSIKLIFADDGEYDFNAPEDLIEILKQAQSKGALAQLHAIALYMKSES